MNTVNPEKETRGVFSFFGFSGGRPFKTGIYSREAFINWSRVTRGYFRRTSSIMASLRMSHTFCSVIRGHKTWLSIKRLGLRDFLLFFSTLSFSFQEHHFRILHTCTSALNSRAAASLRSLQPLQQLSTWQQYRNTYETRPNFLYKRGPYAATEHDQAEFKTSIYWRILGKHPTFI